MRVLQNFEDFMHHQMNEFECFPHYLSTWYFYFLSKILNVIGLLGAKFIFFIPLSTVFCSKTLKVCLNNQNVRFNTFRTIFEWYSSIYTLSIKTNDRDRALLDPTTLMTCKCTR